ncbi:hypothetical protein ACFL1D_03625 [Candidatus Omnitrophota bacterium]
MHSAILILFPVVGLLLGLFFLLKPSLSIEIQKRFYEKINWRIEPVSMSKEIRNTRIMGLFLMTLALLTAGYIVVRF